MTPEESCDLIRKEIHRLAGENAMRNQALDFITDKIVKLAEIRAEIKVGYKSVEDAISELKDIGVDIEKP